jgi:hypothetical protein
VGPFSGVDIRGTVLLHASRCGPGHKSELDPPAARRSSGESTTSSVDAGGPAGGRGSLYAQPEPAIGLGLVSDRRPPVAEQDDRQRHYVEGDRQDFRPDGFARNPVRKRAAQEQWNQHDGSWRPGSSPQATENSAWIPFEPSVKDRPGQAPGQEKGREPAMPPQCRRDNEERRGSLPVLRTIHRVSAALARWPPGAVVGYASFSISSLAHSSATRLAGSASPGIVAHPCFLT